MLVLKASSVQIDPNQNLLHLDNVEAVRPDGSLLARARSVSIQNAIPRSVFASPEPVLVELSGVRGSLRRLNSGDLEIQNYLPKQSTESGKIAFSVRIVNAERNPAIVTLEDFSGRAPWTGDALITSFRLYGVGPRWLAMGAATLKGAGSATARIRSDPDHGLSVDAGTRRFDVAKVFQHFLNVPESSQASLLRSFSAGSFVVSGPIHLILPRKGKLSFGANVVADATSFSYRDEFHADSAHFEGLFTNEGLKGHLTGRGQGSLISYDGALSWGKGVVLGGALDAQIADAATAPNVIKRLLPPKAGFSNGKFRGWIAYSGAGSISVSGTGSADTAKFASEAIERPTFQLNASPKAVTLNLEGGSWQQSQVRGALNFNPTTKAVEGLLRADNVRFADLAHRAGLKGIDGTGEVQALMTGTGQHPSFTVRGSGEVSLIEKGKTYRLGTVEAAADYTGGLLSINRLTIDGPHGEATAEGTWREVSDQVDIDLVGNGIPLAVLNQDLTGEAAFTGKLTGQLRKAQVGGRLEVYGASFDHHEVPLIIASIRADRRGLVASDVQAFRDASRAKGGLSYEFASGEIQGSGEADDIRLSDLVDQKVAGIVNVSNAVLGGTLKHLRIHGDVEGRNLVAKKVEVDSVKGQVSLDGEQLQLLGMVATFSKGTATASGTFDLNTHAGSVQGQISDDLSDLAPVLPEGTDLQGKLAATFAGSFSEGEIHSAKVRGELSDIFWNSLGLGSGPFDATVAGSIWKGSLEVSRGTTALTVDNGQFDAKDGHASGQLSATNIPLRQMVAAASSYIAPDSAAPGRKSTALAVLPDTVFQQLSTVDGTLNASLAVNGDSSNPDLSQATLKLLGLRIGGEAGGSIQAAASRTKGVWNIQALNWAGGPGDVTLKGSIAERGDVHLSGSARNIDPRWLAIFQPGFSRFDGVSNLSFTASGPVKQPEIDSTIDFLRGTPGAQDRQEVTLKAGVRQGLIALNGTYWANGISGPVKATVPFAYPMTIPDGQPISADVSIPSRSIDDLVGLLPWLDTTKTKGDLSADIHLSGTKNELKVNGQAHISAGTLAVKDFQTTVDDFQANAEFAGNQLSLDATGKSSNGGSFTLSKTTLDLQKISDVLGGSSETLLQNKVNGQLDIDRFHIVQNLKGTNPMNLVLGGQVSMSDSIGAPAIRGTVELLNGTLSVPGSQNSAPVNLHPAMNPTFNVKISIPSSVNVKAGLGQFQLTGDGQLGGSLALLNLDMGLVVEKGEVHLPNARIKIDPGGTVHLGYKVSPYGQAIESANVNLAGTTALTANPYGNIIQRYDVDLQIQGDLLDPKGPDITAQADPPDLSQDRILMLLGQGGLIIQQANNGEPRPEQQLQNAAFTSLPFLFDPFTQQLASGLGLDYLDFEYNAFEGVTVTGAKALAKNLVLSARRQLSPPLPGQLVDYDFRLSYRLPFVRKLSNLNLSVGANQLYPWRIALEYGWRF